jgi:peptidoglycan/xylan/chitin deacetylase (PgdA/CDA1 family)
MRPKFARRLVLELASGLTVLGIATAVFIAAHENGTPKATDARSMLASAVPARRTAVIVSPVREIDKAPLQSTCDKQQGTALSRVVEIDATGGPEFGFQHQKGYDFLRDKEVVLTFDDGPWPGSTAAVLRALEDQCLKATFFEIGEHASWHPEITRQVLEAGMTVGTHTWSHKDLARKPYATDLERAEREIEMGNSAVHAAAAGAAVAPFFRFPDLQSSAPLLQYLAHRNVAIFSTDIDSRDFAMHRPEQVVDSVMSQLAKRGKGIILLHDFHRNTAEALPQLLLDLKEAGYKFVHMVPRHELITLAKYGGAFDHGSKPSSDKAM